jgi:hypothetical protein
MLYVPSGFTVAVMEEPFGNGIVTVGKEFGIAAFWVPGLGTFKPEPA